MARLYHSHLGLCFRCVKVPEASCLRPGYPDAAHVAKVHSFVFCRQVRALWLERLGHQSQCKTAQAQRHRPPACHPACGAESPPPGGDPYLGENIKQFRRLERRLRTTLKSRGELAGLFFDRFFFSYLRCILGARLEASKFEVGAASHSERGGYRTMKIANIKILFVAGFGPIVRDKRRKPKALRRDPRHPLQRGQGRLFPHGSSEGSKTT